MLKITIRAGDVDRLTRKLSPDLLAAGLTPLIRDAALLAQRTARDEAPKDTSALARSIMADIRPMSAEVGTSLAYAVPMEEGRRAGAKMPPPDALRGWMRRHGMGDVAPFVLARAIARRGIKGRFYMRKAKQAVEHALPGMINQAARAIAAAWDR